VAFDAAQHVGRLQGGSALTGKISVRCREHRSGADRQPDQVRPITGAPTPCSVAEIAVPATNRMSGPHGNNPAPATPIAARASAIPTTAL